MKLFSNIGMLCGARNDRKLRLVGSEMSDFPTLPNAWLLVDDNGFVDSFGSMESLPDVPHATVVDLKGEWVFPSFCDAHTHIVYAGDRSGEFLDKINGLSYEEIGRRGGGILNSADLLHETSEDSLYEQAMTRVNEMIAKGTGAMEIKSGYGLRTDDELKMLRVINRIAQSVDIPIQATFLGAHAVSRPYAGRKDAYVDLVCSEMIPAVADQGIARFVDVFCDEGYFTPDDTARILEAGIAHGLRPKIHANELAVSGGVQVGVKYGAVSVDHLERCTEAEFEALRDSATMPTCLPGASFFSCLPFAEARRMVESGLGVALASDYNPGSSPSGDMRFVASLGSIRMKLTPAQSLNAVTLNGAYAMGLSHLVGALSPGRLANFFTTVPLPTLQYFLYAYTTPLITATYLRADLK